MVILDTNVVIDFLEGKENVIAEVSKYSASDLAITFVNEYELLKYVKREQLEEVLENLEIYHSSEASVMISANLYKQQKLKGMMISDNDLLIMGVCLAKNETLLTQDKAFESLNNENVLIIK